MGKITALWALFRQGQSVADPALWKTRQITATVLAGVLVALVNVAHAFGLEIPLDMDTANAIAAGAIGVVNLVLTITTSEKVGLISPVSSELDASEAADQ